MSRILKVILYQTAESLDSPRWELRRIANQVGPGHVKNTQSYIIPDCRKSRQSTLGAYCRRIANQVGPGHVKNTQSYIIPDCRKSRQSTLGT